MDRRQVRRAAYAVLLIAVGVALSGCGFLFWLTQYPNADDPKNIDYVLWKHGLNANMNLDAALKAMTHDSRPVHRVAGLSKRQLQDRFGYIRSNNETTPCGEPKDLLGIFGAYSGADEAVTLRDSSWVVLLKNGIAVDLHLCKG